MQTLHRREHSIQCLTLLKIYSSFRRDSGSPRNVVLHSWQHSLRPALWTLLKSAAVVWRGGAAHDDKTVSTPC